MCEGCEKPHQIGQSCVGEGMHRLNILLNLKIFSQELDLDSNADLCVET